MKMRKQAEEFIFKGRGYEVIRREKMVDGRKIIALGLYQIPSGGIYAELAGEIRLYYKNDKKYYSRRVIY